MYIGLYLVIERHQSTCEGRRCRSRWWSNKQPDLWIQRRSLQPL